MPVPKAFTTSDSQLWMTPPKILKQLEAEEGLRFTLDACASRPSARCKAWYDEAKDAFLQDWNKDSQGGAVWCNPPYGEYLGKRVGDWVEKGYKESLLGLTTAFLLPCNKQDQDWYHDLACKYALIRPCKGRIHFLDPMTGQRLIKWSDTRGKFVQDGNSQGSNIILFGPAYKPGPPRSFVVPPD